jgi:tRNA threonylcarbamoyladenosine biosynthesis protein TsaE
MIHCTLAAAADSEGLGATLANGAPWNADRALAIFLSGELGAGKTTVVRGLLRALGVAGVIRSPSYTLLEGYEAGGHRVLHLDLYRLSGAAELQGLGLRDELEGGVLLLVEWPERAREALPRPDLELSLSLAGAGRQAAIQAGSAEGVAWLSRIRGNLPL